MPSKVFLLTHDFKPAFRKTLLHLDLHDDGRYEAEVLLDDRSESPADLNLNRVGVTKCRRHPSAFDPLGQAHNFYLDLLRSDPSLIERYERFWVFENDAYFHGDVVDFLDAHECFDTDLLVPEFGHRDPGWCWLSSARGFDVRPVGVTAVAYRASRRLMSSILEALDNGASAHMEVFLPHICTKMGMSISQFIPDLVGCCNTFPTPLSEMINQEVIFGADKLIQRKLYHPIKA